MSELEKIFHKINGLKPDWVKPITTSKIVTLFVSKATIKLCIPPLIPEIQIMINDNPEQVLNYFRKFIYRTCGVQFASGNLRFHDLYQYEGNENEFISEKRWKEIAKISIKI